MIYRLNFTMTISISSSKKIIHFLIFFLVVFTFEATGFPQYRTFMLSGISSNRRRNSQIAKDDLTFRLDISIDKPINDISDISANLSYIKNGIRRSTVRIPYYGISFKDQRFFILFGTFSKDDEVDYKWARLFFKNYTARLSPSNNYENPKLFFDHQKVMPLFYKEYPNNHIAFRVVTISFTTHKINLTNVNKHLFAFNITQNQKQKNKRSRKNSHIESFYSYLTKTNFNPFNIPCFATGILGEGYDVKMKISGIEFNSTRYSIEVRFYLTLVGFCLLLSFYAWKSLRAYASTQAHISSISILSLILICAYDIMVCLDFSSTSSMNDCFMPPSRLYLFIFFTQMTLYISMQFPIVYNIFKQQELIQQQNIIQTLIEVCLFAAICLLTHLLHIKSLPSDVIHKNNLTHENIFALAFKKINKKRFFLLLISLSQFMPQIFKNLKLSQRRGISMQFIILIGLNRLLLFLYSDIYPYNVYESESEKKNFNYYLSTSLNYAGNNGFCHYFFKLENISFPSLIILLQVLFLFFQQKLGPYFFIPKLIMPRTYNYRSLQPQEGEVCLICRENIIPGEEETAVTPCGHAFHLSCLSRWMEEKQQCPTCRTPIPPINEEDYPPLSRRHKSQNSNQNEINTPFDLAERDNNNINNYVDDLHPLFV